MGFMPKNGYMAAAAARQAAARAPVVPTTNMSAPRMRRVRHDNPPGGGGGLGPPQNPSPHPQYQPTPSVVSGAGIPTTAPQAAGTGSMTPAQTNDDRANQDIASLLAGGPRDTSADEATINNTMQSAASQGSSDALAGLAAGGFGRSGAAGVEMGDIHAAAARQAAQQIMGVREQSRKDYLDKVQMGLGAEMSDRRQDMTEAQWQQYISVLNQQTAEQQKMDDAQNAAQNGQRTAGGGTASGSDSGGYNGVLGWNPFQNPGNTGKTVDPQAAANAQDASTPPLVSYYEGSDANYDYYTDETSGKVYRVPKGH